MRDLLVLTLTTAGAAKLAASAQPVASAPDAAGDAVRYDRNCSWSRLCLGSNAPSAPAAAYYASLATAIKGWGVDFVKIDCMWPHLYEGTPQVYFNEDVAAECAAFTAAGSAATPPLGALGVATATTTPASFPCATTTTTSAA